MSKLNLEITESLEFDSSDIAVIIKQDGSVGKIIMPNMDQEVRNSEGYKSMLEVVELLKPGAKEEFIKHAEKVKGRIH